jgi:hypothetical protein
MSNKYKEQGGGPATGLADSFVQFLSQGLNTGTFGSGTPAGGDAMGSTIGIAGVLNDILSGGAGKLGGSLSQLISNDTNDQVNALRARYGAAGGTAYGTGAQYGEGVIRAKQAPQLASAVGNLQMNAIQNLLGIIGNISQKGITQRQGTVSPSPWATAASIAAPIAGAVLGSFGGPAGTAAGAQIGSSVAGAIGGAGSGGVQQTYDAGAQLPSWSSPMPNVSMIPATNYVPTLFDYGLRKAA